MGSHGRRQQVASFVSTDSFNNNNNNNNNNFISFEQEIFSRTAIAVPLLVLAIYK